MLFNYIYYFPDTDLIFKMADSENNIPNLPSRDQGQDFPRLIRYVAVNIAALATRRPVVRAINVILANAGNIVADVLTDPGRATYWLDQLEFQRANGRFRGGQPGSGPLERGNMPGNTTPTAETSTSATTASTSNTSNFLGDSDTSSFLSYFDFTKILEIFSPVEHSIPLSELINLYFICLLCLFVIVFCMTFIFIYLLVNLIILYNKDYLLGKVKNKYGLWYVKYVLFRSKVDIVIFTIFILISQCFMLYVLHFLIVHPIIIK